MLREIAAHREAALAPWRNFHRIVLLYALAAVVGPPAIIGIGGLLKTHHPYPSVAPPPEYRSIPTTPPDSVPAAPTTLPAIPIDVPSAALVAQLDTFSREVAQLRSTMSELRTSQFELIDKLEKIGSENRKLIEALASRQDETNRLLSSTNFMFGVPFSPSWNSAFVQDTQTLDIGMPHRDRRSILWSIPGYSNTPDMAKGMSKFPWNTGFVYYDSNTGKTYYDYQIPTADGTRASSDK
jgi:hypothetical protein